MSIKANKNGKEYPLGFMPEHYPADRVYLDGDTSKTVQDKVDDLEDFVNHGGTIGETNTGETDLTLGNSTSGNYGALKIFANGSKTSKIVSSASGSDKTNTLPNKDGTFALLSDLEFIRKKTMSATTGDSNKVCAIGLYTTNAIPIAVDCSGCTAYVGTTYQNQWLASFYNYGTGEMISVTNKQITIYYIDLTKISVQS